ncbi:hypothetical protein HETIRDRAFT_332577 [Heterobasidion irregulare TC 32-1]|uniref:Oxidase ustYa n=1 Tax=Heterobasidion irregulare (strain TC 32-1) TaxID=747525 RepID=W4JM92_HETIT|nr:uncharacterized protein HETIRDRAFT_332577 [Heterobasidion irregulare TC 32-1]ETW74672.1 hypothetical protein HETIRDRAFT_332577 [Heterobasidion irregulare TC 32-1]
MSFVWSDRRTPEPTTLTASLVHLLFLPIITLALAGKVVELPVSLPTSALKFEASTRYGLESDEEWHTIMPRGKGFVRLGPNTLPFEVSLYHQIHCLEHLRRTFVDSSCLDDDESAAWHTHHCLNYLHQAIICNADTTLEPSYVLELQNGRKVPAASGIDVVHRCRDWEKLRNVLEDNYDRYSHVPVSA